MAPNAEPYFLDGEALVRILPAPPNGKLCAHIKSLAGQGRVYCCRRCFRDALDGVASPVCGQITGWGVVLIDDDESVDVECARLISNINPAFMRRPDIYQQKLAVIAKCRLNDCILVTDDVVLSSSSMEDICDSLSYQYETFDELFGNL